MRNFGDKTEGDSERPRDNGFVGVLPRSTDNVRPVAAAFGASGGGCRDFGSKTGGLSARLTIRPGAAASAATGLST